MIYTTDVPRLGEGETSAVTLGKFDGLHRGHQKLMNCIREKKEDNCKAVIFTFDVSPVVRLLHTPAKGLLTNEEREELACERGMDILVECPFTDELMHMRSL